MQSRPLQNTVQSQQFNTFFGQTQNYTRQPPQQDPWTGQGPPRNPNTPRSGIAVFDPATDPLDYSAFVNDVDYWAMNNTDPNYLVSPNETMAPPQDLFAIAAQQNFIQQQANNRTQNQPQMQTDNRIEMKFTPASPRPDSQNFVNLDATSPLFTETYITGTDSYQPASPTTSSIDHPVRTSFQRGVASPQASAASPGGSEGMYSSYTQSEANMMIDPYPNKPFDTRLPPAPSPVEVMGEGSFDASPEPESQLGRRTSSNKGTGRPGGRQLGTHLDPKVAKSAHDMRKIVACWHCVLQRDKVRFWISLFLRRLD